MRVLLCSVVAVVVRMGSGITTLVRPCIVSKWFARLGLFIVKLNWQLVTPECPDSERMVSRLWRLLLYILGRRTDMGRVLYLSLTQYLLSMMMAFRP